MDPETFIAVSSWVNTTLLAGVPLRILASATLAATVWFGAYKQRIALGFLFFMLTILLAYFRPLINLIGSGSM